MRPRALPPLTLVLLFQQARFYRGGMTSSYALLCSPTINACAVASTGSFLPWGHDTLLDGLRDSSLLPDDFCIGAAPLCR